MDGMLTPAVRGYNPRRPTPMPSITGGRQTRWTAWCVLFLLTAACRGGGCGRDRSGAAGPDGGASGRVLWTAETGGTAFDGPAVGPDGTIYTVGTLPASEDEQGRPLGPGRTRFALVAVDSGGRVTRTLPGSVIGGGYSNIQMWVRMSSWGTAYAIDSLGGLYGMFSDGSQQYRFVKGVLVGPPAIAENGRLFAGANRATVGFDLQAIDDPTAARFQQGSFLLPPAVGPDGLLYVGSRRGIEAVDANGETRWVARASPSAPVLDDQGLVYFADRNRLVALDGSGSERWQYEGTDPLSVPVFSPEGAMVVVGQAGLVQVVGLDGRRRWRFPLATAAWARPGVGPDGTVYVTDRAGRVSAVAPGGTVRWSIKLAVPAGRPAVGADGTAYVQGSDGLLRAIGP
jgi:hypothetical protein